MKVPRPLIARLIFATVAGASLVAGIVTLPPVAVAQNCPPFEAGQKALNERRFDEAGEQFRQAIADGCQAPAARRGLAEVAYRRNRLHEAERLYRDAIAALQEAGLREAGADRAGLGLTLLRLDRVDEAAEEIRRAVELEPSSWAVQHARARLLLAQAKWEDANAALERIAGLAASPRTKGELTLARALYYDGTGNIALAESEAVAALNLDPADPERLAVANRICQRRGGPDVSIALLEQIKRDAGPTPPPSVLTELGRVYMVGRRFNEARDQFVAAVGSEYPPAYLELANLMALAKRPADAISLLQKYVTVVPADVDAMLKLVDVALEAGQTELAAKTAQQAMAAAPKRADVRAAFARAGMRSADPKVRATAAQMAGTAGEGSTAEDWLAMAEHQRAGGDFAAALASARKAAALAPDAAEPAFELGIIQVSAGRPLEAVAHLQKAIERKPDSAPYRLNLGIALVAAGRRQEGLAAMRQAVAADQRYTQGRLTLARTLAAADSTQAAGQQLRAILAYEPTSVPARCELGWMLLREGTCGEALAMFRSATEADARSVQALAGLGSSYVCLGDRDRGAEALERARALDPANEHVKRGFELLNEASAAQQR